MELPAAVRQALAAARKRSIETPELALNHAVELDNHLYKAGWRAPLTYAARGEAVPGTPPFSRDTGAVHASKRHMGILHQADQLARQHEALQGIALAFMHAHGTEVPALNLLYANQALEVESLWLRFINKYLAYLSESETQEKAPYQLDLEPGLEPRFQRLRSAHLEHLPRHGQGPLISVLMPVYNAETTLHLAVRSILEQTWQSLELLLIDDASTDASRVIAESLQQQDPRVRVLTLRTNGGPYVAKNVGLVHARGQYLTVHDADDWAFPTRLADQILPLINAPDGEPRVTMGRMLRMQENGRVTRFRDPDWIAEDGVLRLCFPSLLFERNYFEQRLGAWDSVRVGADAEILARIRRYTPQCLRVIERPLMLQLDASQSLTTNDATYLDERGVAPIRRDYQQAWESWHNDQAELPRLQFPLDPRPFQAPAAICSHRLGADALLERLIPT
ncbi:Putative glycosyltransferase EpsE [Thiorhodovibrio winogradskyi]|uniref:Glycosyltransferase EpsE n=1 Tax=Thiorhodovibrio winogradskyi TaxID=77007 RepID=A0ABZ0SCE2_9GAMM|nr:glycosyltransferase family A protein [Thiorhodovibrio winogradskyi]